MFGLVYAPALADFYVTLGPDEAVTAHLEPHAEVANIAACRPTRLRTPVPDPHALRALTSQTHLNSATQRFLDGYNVVDRKAVSSSLKFGLIAKGEADLYPRVGPTSEWDTAAGHAVLAAAGGSVTTLDGSAAHLRQSRPPVHQPGFRGLGARAVAKNTRSLAASHAKWGFRPHFGNTLRQLSLIPGASRVSTWGPMRIGRNQQWVDPCRDNFRRWRRH